MSIYDYDGQSFYGKNGVSKYITKRREEAENILNEIELLEKVLLKKIDGYIIFYGYDMNWPQCLGIGDTVETKYGDKLVVKEIKPNSQNPEWPHIITFTDGQKLESHRITFVTKRAKNK
jgi:hypothetical protein